jgi:hypothetical protein
VNETSDQPPTDDAAPRADTKVTSDGRAALKQLERFTRRVVRVPIKDVRKLEKRRKRA